MESFHESMIEYKKQLEKGAIQAAYKGLMEYMMALRTHLKDKYPDYSGPGGVYFGYMDMTYFAFNPQSLKGRNLKVAIVFVHETFRFEAWLAGYNKQVQAKYWKLFKDNNWTKYRLVPTLKGVDSILEHVLVDHPDFGELDALTQQIERETLGFIKDVEDYLSGKP